MLDAKILPSGAKDYNQLKNSYVIFICQFDPFGMDKCFYSFEERCLEELSFPLGDGTKKIFLNTGGANREEITDDLREFLDYIKAPNTMKLQSEKVKMVDERVNKVKTDAEVRSKYMTLANWIEEKCDQARELAMEEGRAEGRAEGHSTGLQEGKIESKVELLHVIYRKGYEVTEAVELFDLEEDFVGNLYELFQNYPEESDGKIAERYFEMLKKCGENAMLEKKPLLEIGMCISQEDEAVKVAFEQCLSNMDAYFEEHVEDFEDRGFDEDELEEVEEQELQWIALADSLINHVYCCELDWKCDKEEFADCVNELQGMEVYDLTLEEDWLDEDADVTEWCAVLDEKWQEKGVCIAALDIDSDSYVIFPILESELDKLMELAEKVDGRIALAKEM